MKRNKYIKPIFPICLLAENRSCLVVGAGKVALRKIRSLLEAKANVTVVAPEIKTEIKELFSKGLINLFEREFKSSDLENKFVVFAATSNKEINRKVLDLCSSKKILCSCVDGNWAESDFVSPATFRESGLTISVSSGGKSCRRSRLVKKNLVKHIEMVTNLDKLVVGTSHNYLPLETREKFQLTGDKLIETGKMIAGLKGIHEFILLNTCNRMELIAIVSLAPEVNNLLKRIFGFDKISDTCYYEKRGFDAFKHLATVTAGLRSQVPGEHHIVAQVKEALNLAEEQNWAGGMMHDWISSALHLSKDIRKVTTPILHGFEIEDLGIDYLKVECQNFSGKTVMIIGAGIIGKGLVRRAVEAGCNCYWCYHSNKPEMPLEWQNKSRLFSLNELRERLPSTDIVICATNSSGYVLHKGHAPFFDREKEITIIDLSIPRNVEPEIHNIMPGLKVVDLDDLKHWYRKETVDMTEVFKLTDSIIAKHKKRHDKIINSFQNGNENQ